MALKMLEWIPPQRPRSEDTAMMRWFGLRSSERTSDLSNNAVREGGEEEGVWEEVCRGGGGSVHRGRGGGGCVWEGRVTYVNMKRHTQAMSHEHEQWEPHTGGSLAIGPGWF